MVDFWKPLAEIARHHVAANPDPSPIVEVSMSIVAMQTEIDRLRAANAALVAVCECQEAFVAYARSSGSRGEMIGVFLRHGWDGEESSAEFTDRIRRAALAAAAATVVPLRAPAS